MLSDEQKAVLTNDGDIYLSACPGSGKTHTLAHKIASEVDAVESHREFVIGITYTHVAAEELRERVEKIGADTRQLWVGTIHSFCLKWILRPYSVYHPKLKAGYTVIDTNDREELLDHITRQDDYPLLKNHNSCQHFATPQGFELVDSRAPEQARRAVSEYHKHLARTQQIDFDLMLKFAHELVRDTPLIPVQLSKLFRFIGVDEFQDTREIQYEIVGRIARACRSRPALLFVGDPNQAIFGSLGGEAKPACEIESITGRKLSRLSLTRNYRSSQQVVNFYSRFATTPASISAAGTLADSTGNIVHDKTVHKSDIVRAVAQIVCNHTSSDVPEPRNYCLVAPWWTHLAPLTRSLAVELPDCPLNGPGLSPFGQNLDNFWYKIARLGLTEPSPLLYPRRIRWACEILEELSWHGFSVHNTSAAALLRCSNLSTAAASVTPLGSGSAFLKNFFAEFNTKMGLRIMDSPELQSQQTAFFDRLHKRATRIWDEEQLNIDDLCTFKRVFRPKDGLKVSTIHGIKGEEYDVVIAFGLLNGFVPHFSDSSGESAQKTLFVLGSRAKRHLYLISETGRMDHCRCEREPTPQLTRRLRSEVTHLTIDEATGT